MNTRRRLQRLVLGGWLLLVVRAVREEEPGQTTAFGVHWPPRDPAAAAAGRPLLDGQVKSRVSRTLDHGWVVSLQIVLSRATNESARASWNARLAFPEFDWMDSVKVWDAERRWLWPNLPLLLRLPGKERSERYGGVDPGKGVDNDFAAVLIRKYDSSGHETEDTSQAPLVSGEWRGATTATGHLQAVVHTALSDEFTLHLDRTGKAADGRAGIWLIYADFLGAKPPANWPREPEYAGGILAYFEARWGAGSDGRFWFLVVAMPPPRPTGFDWERWSSRVRAGPEAWRLAKLSDRPR